MEYDITLHGDWLEKEAAIFIRTHIPAYEEIWKRYIGNDGNSKIAKMQGINKADEEKRLHFSQHHYTVLESLYFMEKIYEDIKELNPIESFDDYRNMNNQIMAFQAYSGRLRDNILSCYDNTDYTFLNAKEADKIDGYYQERHIFIHGRKVPFGIDEMHLFQIPKVNTIKWGNDFGGNHLWSHIKLENLRYLSDEFKESLDGLRPLVNGILEDLLQAIKKKINEKNLLLVTPSENSYNQQPPSGSIHYNI